ncbi:30S ribosomal protein S12 methylthiotransferase RimO, partial [Oceanithermus sp.]|uniref:30S ribosomal protein S12 methylthiotransferase RimO n=1 Tax=Oceanithermus sp. TaxID=2268145 RepID=UPI0025FA6AEB
GCLGARPEVIRSKYPQVIDVSGPAETERVLAAVATVAPPERDPFLDLVPPQVKLTPRHYAYLKIAEGCDHKCSFCIIPQLRGGLASRDAADVLAEAARLAAGGTRELLVIAQDTSAYGVDLGHRASDWAGKQVRARLADLVRELGGLVPWVRLHYVYPYPHVRELLPLMAEGRLLPYLDVPLQHASPRVLRAMRRPGEAESHLATIQAWREAVPELAIRSSFIVGFPGETEEDFALLLDFLEEARLDRVGVFTYSPVAGAAANALPGAVPEEVKQERRARVMELARRISLEKNRAKVGRVLEVILDEPADEPGVFIGRTQADSPGIDGTVRVTTDGTARVGEIVNVRITAADVYDLEGEAVASVPAKE